MLKSLNFVKGAVARKDFVPALTHFRIKGGRITGYNGALALSCPIPLDLDCCPKAETFIKAINASKEAISLSLSPSGRLMLKSGKFRANIECLNEDFPPIAINGTRVNLNGGILATLKALAPFIGEDASRPWARGILLKDNHAYATNNIVVIEKELGFTMPIAINLPEAAVDELLRIGEEPEFIFVDEGSCTFFFEGERWLKTQLYTTAWADLSRIFSSEANPKPIPAGFFDALQDLKPFIGKSKACTLGDGKVDTTAADQPNGASVDVEGLTDKAVVNLELMLLLKPVASTIDLSLYPKPIQFFSAGLRGAIAGIRG